jgi:hypothetical protein
MHSQQSWASHFGGAGSTEYGSAAEHPFDWTALLKNWDALIPVLVGIATCVAALRNGSGRDAFHSVPDPSEHFPHFRASGVPLRLPDFEGRCGKRPYRVVERWLGLEGPRSAAPLAWLALMLGVFGLHKPWWPYYYIHTAIPLCWLAGIGVSAKWRGKNEKRGPGGRERGAGSAQTGPQSAVHGPRSEPRRLSRLWSIVYGLLALGWIGARIYLEVTVIRHSPQLYYAVVVKEIERVKGDTKFMYADHTIYSFHSGIPMPPQLVFYRPGVSPPPPAKLPSKRWRDLTLRVWHVDPLLCPVCQSPMRVIAVIDDPRVTEKILRHLGAWHDPPPRPPPSAVPGPYTYEPCDDVDPTPDYENVLTD